MLMRVIAYHPRGPSADLTFFMPTVLRIGYRLAWRKLTLIQYDSELQITHLDRAVIRALVKNPTQAAARFVVPLGVGAHLEKWGVSADRINELDWGEATTVGPLTITATSARHFPGRGLFDRNHTLGVVVGEGTSAPCFSFR